MTHSLPLFYPIYLPSTCPSVYPTVYPSSTCPSVSPTVYPPPVHLSIQLHVHPPPVHPPICSPIHTSSHPPPSPSYPIEHPTILQASSAMLWDHARDTTLNLDKIKEYNVLEAFVSRDLIGDGGHMSKGSSKLVTCALIPVLGRLRQEDGGCKAPRHRYPGL